MVETAGGRQRRRQAAAAVCVHSKAENEKADKVGNGRVPPTMRVGERLKPRHVVEMVAGVENAFL